MRTGFKKILDKIFHPLGLTVERYFGEELSLKHLVQICKEQKIDLVLDVGANVGQFAQKIISKGYGGKIISFEPLSSAYPILKKNAANKSQWEVFDRCAIGDFNGDIQINISENNHSSSILEVTKEHLKAAPSAASIGTEMVPIKTLDSIAAHFDNANKILLKIDTQGFEKNVLDGAKELLNNKVNLLQLEVSLIPLYSGSMTFQDSIAYLDNCGFRPLFYAPGYTDRNSDEIQQLEGYFIKK